MTSPFDARPIVVAIAGPNGAGKSTFFAAHLQAVGLRFVNADEIGRELGVGAYEAAEAAGHIRQALLGQRESFVFETVFSDPVGEKIAFLLQAERSGYTVVLCFVGLDGPELGEERVTMRNLRQAIRELPHVLVFDNGDLARPFRHVATFERGKMVDGHPPLPRWLPSARRRRAGCPVDNGVPLGRSA